MDTFFKGLVGPAEDQFLINMHFTNQTRNIMKKITIILTTLLFCMNIYSQCQEPPANLISWWAAENNTEDSIGTNDGEALNGLSYAIGSVNNAFLFDGVDDVVLVPDNSNLDITGDLTIELWVRQTVFNPENTVISKGAEDAENAYSIRFLGQIFECVFKDNLGNDVVLGGPAFEDFQWHHYAYVRQGNQHQIYADGFGFGAESFINLPASSTGLPLTIGAQYNSQNSNYTNFFGGEIDEVSIYNRALTESEIQNIFNAGTEGKCNGTSGTGEDFVFWGSQSSEGINSSSIDGTNQTEILDGQTMIRRLKIHQTEEKLYWALPSESKIKKANFDGTQVEDVITTTSDINVVTIDEINSAIYYSEGTDGTIKKCDLDGLNPQTVVSGLGTVQGIAINNVLNKLYWTEFDTGLLKSANLDGSNIQTLLSTADALFDVDVDPINEYLYFSNRTSNVIERVDLDGLNRTLIVSATGNVSVIKLDVINNKIYWVFNETGASGIAVVNTDGTDESNIISSATDNFSGMDVAIDQTLSVDNYQNKLSVTIFPNPTTDVFNLEIKDELQSRYHGLQLSIYDINGRNVMQKSISKTQTTIDVSLMSKGVYLYTLQDQNSVLTTGKFIKR